MLCLWRIWQGRHVQRDGRPVFGCGRGACGQRRHRQRLTVRIEDAQITQPGFRSRQQGFLSELQLMQPFAALGSQRGMPIEIGCTQVAAVRRNGNEEREHAERSGLRFHDLDSVSRAPESIPARTGGTGVR